MKKTITSIPIGDCRIEVINIYNITQEGAVQTEIKHNHSFYEIHIIRKGVSYLMVDDVVYEAPQNSIIIIPRNKYHYAVGDRESVVFNAFSFDIVKDKKSSMVKKQEFAYFNAILDSERPIILPFNENLARIYGEIFSLQGIYDVYSVNKLQIKIAEFFLEITNCVLNEKILKSDEFSANKYHEEAIRKQKIEDMLSRNLNKKLEDFANEIYLSPRQFERFVLKIYGKPFKEIMMEKRMVRAKQLIKEGKLTLSKIAYIVGFLSYGGFFVAYKKFYGESPTETQGKKS